MTAPVYALTHALAAHPGARRCAAIDNRGRPTCPWPLDPANGDEAYHMWCAPGAQRALAAAVLADARRRSATARAALGGGKGAAA